MAFVGDSPDISGGPFQANTRIVAIIALTVAGVFVCLGLALSVLRVLQQRAIDRVCSPGELLEKPLDVTLSTYAPLSLHDVIWSKHMFGV